KRRGQILGMEPAEEPGYQKVSATVPMSEMSSYAIELRSMSRGRGSFDLQFASYQDAPANIAQKVIAAAKDEGDDD
ncbi:MAG: elongation factor G, partial [Clostridia bacterium]|nr:elongation factor G [Clostridia bacterium]